MKVMTIDALFGAHVPRKGFGALDTSTPAAASASFQAATAGIERAVNRARGTSIPLDLRTAILNQANTLSAQYSALSDRLQQAGLNLQAWALEASAFILKVQAFEHDALKQIDSAVASGGAQKAYPWAVGLGFTVVLGGLAYWLVTRKK